MKKLLIISAALAVLISCTPSNTGQLIGVKGKSWHPEKPHGMTLVPGGAFIMGKSDEDRAGLLNAPTKTVTVRSFYMDETEITNSEYRQFTEWVKDSIALFELAKLADDVGKTTEDEGIGQFAFRNTDEEELNEYQKYVKDNYEGLGETGYEGRPLNWDNDPDDMPFEEYDEYIAEVMDSLYIRAEESHNGVRMFKMDKLNYDYKWYDVEAMARSRSRDSKKFLKRESLPVYPDTTVWIRDFNYSYNEPMHDQYFYHAAYDEYPVVGVTWAQARAFCDWRTKFFNDKRKKKQDRASRWRLPTEAEWEYAARGGLESGSFPWGGPYAKNDRGCFLANFKPMRGDYAADQALYTVEAKSFDPNDYGLYNMAGNVSEWVGSSYDPAAYEYTSSMNPNTNDDDNERKVIRGGSWKDVAYFLQVSTRDYEYADSARSYIGFRTVQDYLGTDITGGGKPGTVVK